MASPVSPTNLADTDTNEMRLTSTLFPPTHSGPEIAPTRKYIAPTTFDAYPTGEMFDTIIRITIDEASSPTNTVDKGSVQPNTLATFQVHKGILMFYSDYFRGSLRGEFREAQEKHISLDSKDVTKEAFALFKGWIYTRKLATNDIPEEHLDIGIICMMWTFADAHLCPLLMNHCINLGTKRVRTIKVTPDAIHCLYNNTTKDSNLRRALIHAISKSTYDATKMTDQTKAEDWPQEFFFDLLTTFSMERARMTNKLDSKVDFCQYHEHERLLACTVHPPSKITLSSEHRFKRPRYAAWPDSSR